tara:strand:- start:4994 stop:5173 length:180 start_codon:yes stop_codon:yes gene_type:complete
MHYKLIKTWTEFTGKKYLKGCSIGISETQAIRFAKKGYIELEKKETKTVQKKENKIEKK